MTVAGIVFSNIHDRNIPELTSRRTMASVPFGCRYRFIDFTLSNMVNSNIYTIHVITHYNYQSLMDHIGSGKDWDLARRSGGIKILPPYITAYDNNRNALYATRLEALKSVHNAINHMKEDYVVMSDCDVICNVDLNDLIRDHIASGADMTLAVKHMTLTPERARISILYESDENGRITDGLPYPADFSGEADVSLNIVVMSRTYLQQIVLDAIAHDYSSMTRDVILRQREHRNFRVYHYDGYFACVSSLAEYYRCNMELLTNDFARTSLFGEKNRPVYTKIHNSSPTYYSQNSSVRDSLIADGCVIEGTVENSVIFRGVKVSRNSTVRNSILMQDTYVGENVLLNSVITDKNVQVADERQLTGSAGYPLFISKGAEI